jgi:6-pyruvoyltetrahydropterin/6-carboxytetrahydropterin synthase
MINSNVIPENTEISVTKCFDFCYGHCLPNYDGNCKNQHGHNSRVEVEVRYPCSATKYPGMVLDFKLLKQSVEKVLESLDHCYLNSIWPFLQSDFPPTAEHICIYIYNCLKSCMFGDSICRVRVSETPDSWAEIKVLTKKEVSSPVYVINKTEIDMEKFLKNLQPEKIDKLVANQNKKENRTHCKL